MRGTEKSLSDFLRYFGILENKNRKCSQKNTGEYYGEYPQKITGNIRTRIVTKKLQILDKWELQGIKGNGNRVMCTGGVVMLRHPPQPHKINTFLGHLWSPT